MTALAPPLQTDITDPSAVYAFQQSCTIAMVAGVVPIALLFYGLGILRLRYTDRVVRKFRDAAPGTKSKFIHKFEDAREVEICARCCRK